MEYLNYSSRQGVTPCLNISKALILDFCNGLITVRELELIKKADFAVRFFYLVRLA
jgi:hypothetical protein